jgi:hypothetical protein
MIKRNAIPCTQPCQVSGFPPLSIGTSTRNAAKISATPTWRAARPRHRSQPVAHCHREDHNQQAGNKKGRNLRHPYAPHASELGHGTCSPPTNSQPSRWRYAMLAQVFNPTEIRKNGPARRPPSTPARCSAAPFTAASALLPATRQSLPVQAITVVSPYWAVQPVGP